MPQETIQFTQDTLFEIFKQSAMKFGLRGSAKIFVTNKNGVLEVQHIAPEETDGEKAPKVTALSAFEINSQIHVMD